MNGTHPDLGPELRQLAQAVLDRLDPAVRIAAARAAAAASGSGRCEQLWCPVCALAASVNGEQHPLLSVIAEHSVGLLAVVRAMVGDTGPDTPPGQSPPTPAPPADGDAPPSAPGHYEHIPVTLQD